MRTLFIEYHYLKGNQGAIYAARTHINLFAELSEEMTLIYPNKKGKEPEGILDLDRINMIPVDDKRNKFQKFVGLCFGKMHRYNYNRDIPDLNNYDVVVFDTSDVSSRLIKKVRKTKNLKIITIHHNYQIDFLWGNCRKLLLLPCLFWTRIYESEAVRESDLNISLTPQDAILLKKHYSPNANFSTLGVFDYQRKEYPQIDKKERGHNYLITGGLAAKQNEDSIIPWLKKYYPILKEIDNKANLTLAGRSPSQRLVEAVKKVGANIIPSPPDMNSILLNEDYYICPTDRGGGLKLRIMDGLKYGLPVLTHSVSARGYENMIEAGLIFSYNDEKSFVESLRKMIDTNIIQSEAQNMYSKYFSFENGLRTLSNILAINGFISEPKL